MVKHLVVISDLHAGSRLAPIPPNMRDNYGAVYTQNNAQAWLWDRWREFWGEFVPWVVGKDEWSFVLNGDAVEGVHHNNHHERVDNATNTDGDIARALLEPVLAKAKKKYVVLGTRCHVHDAEHSLGKALGSEKDEVGQHASQVRYIRLGKHLCRFGHHISGTARHDMRAAKVGQMVGQMAMVAGQDGTEFPRCCVWSHRHTHIQVRDESSVGVTTPPWQLGGWHASKLGIERSVVGGIVLSVNEYAQTPRVTEYVRHLDRVAEVKA